MWSPCDVIVPDEEGAAVEGKSGDDEELQEDPRDPLAVVLPMLSGWGLAQCRTSSVLPNLITRRAREEDCDDVAPVFEAKSDVTRQSFGSFFLADAVRRQGGGRSAVVGCDPYTHRAVALAAASDAPPLRLLRGAFDLAPFGGLVKPSEHGAAVSAAAAVEASRRRSDWLAVLQEHGNELGGVFGAAARRSRQRLVKEVKSQVERDSKTAAEGAGGGRPEGADGLTPEMEEQAVTDKMAALGVSPDEEWCFAQELCALLDRRGPTWGWQGAGKLGSATLSALCSPACTGAPDRDAWPIAREATSHEHPEGLVHLHMPDSPVARIEGANDEEAAPASPEAAAPEADSAAAGAADPGAEAASGAGASESKEGEPGADGGEAAAGAPAPAPAAALPTPEEASAAVVDRLEGEVKEQLMKAAADHEAPLPAQPLLELATSTAAPKAACRLAGAIDPAAIIRRDDLDRAVAEFSASRQRRRRRARLAALWSWGRGDADERPASSGSGGGDEAEEDVEGGDGSGPASARKDDGDATDPDKNKVWSAVEREIGALVEAELQSRREAAAARAEAAAAEEEARKAQQEAARAEAAVLGDDEEDEDDEEDGGFSPRPSGADDDSGSLGGDDSSRVGELDDMDLDDLED